MQLLRRYRLSAAGLAARQLSKPLPVVEIPASEPSPAKVAEAQQVPAYLVKYEAWKKALWER